MSSWAPWPNSKDYTTICTAAPSEFLSLLALRHRREILGRNLEIIGRNLEYLDAFFEKHRRFFSWQRPRAGPVAFPAATFVAASDGLCAGLLATRESCSCPAACSTPRRSTSASVSPAAIFVTAWINSPPTWRGNKNRRGSHAGKDHLA